MRFTPQEAAKLIAMPGATLGPVFRMEVDDPEDAGFKAETRLVKDPELVTPGVAAEKGRLTILIPAITRSEANESAWVKKMSRKLSCKKAVRDALGLHHGLLTPFAEAYHSGKALRVVFTRLGGRKLDRGNLSVSMKVVEDMIEGALLASDGDPRWHSSYEQVPGGPVGVRVELEVI